MVRKNRGIYGFLGTSWVPITMASRNIVLRSTYTSKTNKAHGSDHNILRTDTTVGETVRQI